MKRLLLLQLIPLALAAITEAFIFTEYGGKNAKLCAEKRTIGDYMGGTHAGKYEFDSRYSGVTSFNYEKSKIFDDNAGQPGTKFLAKVPDSEPPSWSFRTIDLESSGSLKGIIQLTPTCIGAAKGVGVTVQNDEISWEPFYATIEVSGQLDSPQDLCLGLTPTSGFLAPRGGANNACNVNKPYSDSCILTVYYTEPPDKAGIRTPVDQLLRPKNNIHLVVKTEMEHWNWLIGF